MLLVDKNGKYREVVKRIARWLKIKNQNQAADVLVIGIGVISWWIIVLVTYAIERQLTTNISYEQTLLFLQFAPLVLGLVVYILVSLFRGWKVWLWNILLMFAVSPLIYAVGHVYLFLLKDTIVWWFKAIL